MAIEIFDIVWTKPQPITDASTQSASQEGGVYARYRLIGQTAHLNYIGVTSKFYRRSAEHRNASAHVLSESERQKDLISFGIVSCFGVSRMTDVVTPKQLKDLESFLINKKKPSGNGESTKKGFKGCAIIVSNSGTRGSFEKVMTNNPDLIKHLQAKI